MQSQSICKENFRFDTLVSEIDERKERNMARMEALRQKKELAVGKAIRDKENSSKIERKVKGIDRPVQPKKA